MVMPHIMPKLIGAVAQRAVDLLVARGQRAHKALYVFSAYPYRGVRI